MWNCEIQTCDSTENKRKGGTKFKTEFYRKRETRVGRLHQIIP